MKRLIGCISLVLIAVLATPQETEDEETASETDERQEEERSDSNEATDSDSENEEDSKTTSGEDAEPSEKTPYKRIPLSERIGPNQNADLPQDI